MAAGDATIVTFAANDQTSAVTALETLTPATGDFVISWQENNQVYVAKIEQT